MYSIQIAAANVDKTTFGESDEEMVTEIEFEDDLMDAHPKRMKARKRIEEIRKQGLPRIDADERGSEKTSPRINTDQTDQDGELGKMLPQAVGEVYANRGQTAEVQANLPPRAATRARTGPGWDDLG